MKIGYQYFMLIAGGLAFICWGLPAAHRLKSPFDILPALAVLAGLAACVLGVLLIAIPDFFR